MSKDYELEFLRLENQKLKDEIQRLQQSESNSGVDLDEVKELITLATDMRETLILCRKEQINISVAKRIDNILIRAKEFDE